MPNVRTYWKQSLTALGDNTGAKNVNSFYQKVAVVMANSAYTDTKARNAIKTKTQINALTGASVAADITTALKA